MKTLLSLGHGYSAAALARRLLPQGWEVIGTTRSPEKAGALRAARVAPLLWPGDLAPALARASHILTSAGPDAAGDPFLRAVPAIAAAGAQWVGYLSTTAVCGDHQGGWGEGDTGLTPASGRGRWRVLGGAEWQATGVPVEVFRLAGIYGPGRGPFEKVRNGSARRILKPGQVFSRHEVLEVLPNNSTDPHAAEVTIARMRRAMQPGHFGDPTEAWRLRRKWFQHGNDGRNVIRASHLEGGKDQLIGDLPSGALTVE